MTQGDLAKLEVTMEAYSRALYNQRETELSRALEKGTKILGALEEIGRSYNALIEFQKRI